VKSVPRKNILSAFVGRLHLDTSEEELTKFFTNEGIKGVVCRKLVAKNGKKSSTQRHSRSHVQLRAAIYSTMTNLGLPVPSYVNGFITRDNGTFCQYRLL